MTNFRLTLWPVNVRLFRTSSRLTEADIPGPGGAVPEPEHGARSDAGGPGAGPDRRPAGRLPGQRAGRARPALLGQPAAGRAHSGSVRDFELLFLKLLLFLS